MAKLFHNLQDSKILETLSTLPKKQKTSYTAEEIVTKFFEPIKKALDDGYTFTEIAKDAFKANNCNISGATLKSEYNKLVPSKGKKKVKPTSQAQDK